MAFIGLCLNKIQFYGVLPINYLRYHLKLPLIIYILTDSTDKLWVKQR